MLDALNAIYNFLTHGIYQLFTDMFASLMEWLILSYINTVKWGITFGWGIAQQVLSDLHLSEHLNDAFSQIPGEWASYIRFFRLPEAITNLCSAFITRFVLKFIPGI